MSTRRLRIVKYRGSAHGTNEYPFLIDEHGLSGPADHFSRAEPRRLRRADLHGIPRLDAMFGGQGLLPRNQCADLRHGRDREEQHRRPLCGGFLPAE